MLICYLYRERREGIRFQGQAAQLELEETACQVHERTFSVFVRLGRLSSRLCLEVSAEGFCLASTTALLVRSPTMSTPTYRSAEPPQQAFELTAQDQRVLCVSPCVL